MERLILATWKLIGLGMKDTKLCRELRSRKTNIAILIKTKKKFRSTMDTDGFKMIYSGVDRNGCDYVVLWCCDYISYGAKG